VDVGTQLSISHCILLTPCIHPPLGISSNIILKKPTSLTYRSLHFSYHFPTRLMDNANLQYYSKYIQVSRIWLVDLDFLLKVNLAEKNINKTKQISQNNSSFREKNGHQS
jgi:hypothetical protein